MLRSDLFLKRAQHFSSSFAKSVAKARRAFRSGGIVAAVTAICSCLSFVPALADGLCADLKKGEKPACDVADGGGCDVSGGKFALVFGNSDYAADVVPLPASKDDANLIARVLSEQYNFKVRCILNARSDQVEEQLKHASAAAKAFAASPEKAGLSRLVIYYSGHGEGQKAGDEGSAIFIDATKSNPDAAAISVGYMWKQIRDKGSSIVSPILLIDACRVGGKWTSQGGPSTVVAIAPAPTASVAAAAAVSNIGADTADAVAAASPNNPFHFFVGYAVPEGAVASGGQNRFTLTLAPEFEERGRSFRMIWEEARLEYLRVLQASSAIYGPQSSTVVPPMADQLFLSKKDDRCGPDFLTTWGQIWQSREGNSSVRQFLKTKSYLPGDSECAAWKDVMGHWREDDKPPPADCASIPRDQCGEQIKCRFYQYYQSCREPQVAELEEQTPTPTAVALAEERIDSEAAVTTRGLEFEEPAERRLTMSAAPAHHSWREVVSTKSLTGLRRLPTKTEAPHTQLPAGTELNVDCQTLVCDSDWLGVRYKAKGQAEWRGFIPRDDAAVQAPQRTISIAFVANGTALTPQSTSELEALVKAHPKGEDWRIRISARFVPANDEEGSHFERQKALLRMSAINKVLRAAGAYKNQSVTKPKFELISSSTGQSDAFVEIY